MSGPGLKSPRRLSEVAWYAGGIAAVFVVIALLSWVIRGSGNGNADELASEVAKAKSQTAADQAAQNDQSSPGEADGESKAPPAKSTDAGVVPTDRVAYLTADGRVLSGIGANAPVEVASGAAIGSSGLGSLAISPTGDLIAFVRSDGALVTVPVQGSEHLQLTTL
ncbi:MAG TPA: hypothetical protein VL068_10430, partial [Microthrixaceae bacterium]|nr:hypothetical protein [Microthrixaceae bacterium]